MKATELVRWILFIFLVIARPANAIDDPTNAPAFSPPSAGLLPIPDYSSDFWTRQYLSGDWAGLRTDLANKGIQFGLQFNQYVQGVTDGGKDRATEYGGNVDYTLNLDLMRMGILPGALIKFRAETRYGRSVNNITGTVFPVNTSALFPLGSEIDQDIPITITDLNYTQFLSEHLGVTLGKIDTLDGDLNEFASGRGSSQFMNANFIFDLAMGLRLPYSTLGAGVIWMPIPASTNGGITVSSIIMNTADSSTTSGFEDFGKGATWITEADFQYRLASLPGGMNVGGLWSFDQDFARLNTRLVLSPGEGLTIPTRNSTWAIYWSAWQYLFVRESADHPIDLFNGQPDRKGVGLFARVGFADKETNPVELAVSGGVGGRGLIPTRDYDNFGIGYYYNSIQTTRLFSVAGIEDSTQGFECFYNVAITPAFRVTFDLQVVKPIEKTVDTATVLGARVVLSF